MKKVILTGDRPTGRLQQETALQDVFMWDIM